MATTDLRTDTTDYPAVPIGGAFTKKYDLSFATYNAGAADIFQMTNLRAGAIVAVIVQVTTGEGAAASIDVVTTETSPQTLINDGSIENAGFLGGAQLFKITEACTLNVVANTAATDTAVIELNLMVFQD